eukprot:TRINITY_DN4342_c0_g1_i1.p1 TRINITY_DN4342_c0_g1~~TRINITY_DN4342_c0_g1_i1.p1  ORF type:complete len:736 (-),score=229.44 TRINITY_DN4342_c0_g1_i1:148-2355(-)
MARRVAVICSAIAAANGLSDANALTPVERVVKMLEDLKTQVKDEQAAEAKTYATFKKFCDDNDADKTKAISDGELQEQTSTATIESKTGRLGETNSEIKDRTRKNENLNSEKDANLKQCAKDKKAYDIQNADLTAAVAGLKGAVEKLTAAKDTANAFVQVRAVPGIQRSIELAEALGLLQNAESKKVTAFLQDGSSGPWSEAEGAEHNKEEYGYQSDGILKLIKDLHEQFTTQKTTADADNTARETSCTDTDKAKADAIQANSEALATAKTEAATLEGEIAEEKQTLLETKKTLKTDRSFLAELKEDCAAREKDNAQRQKMQTDEMAAIGQALAVLSGKVADMDKAVKDKSFLQVSSFVQSNSNTKVKANLLAKSANNVHARNVAKNVRALSHAKTSSASMAQVNARIKSAATQIAEAGRRLGSHKLQGLALMMSMKEAPNAAENPLLVVKQMVQGLVEKLLKQAEEDTTTKGMCDSQMGSAKQDRNRRMTEAKRISAKINALNTKRSQLLQDNSVMATELTKLREDLASATTMRTTESEENAKTISDAKEGKVAVASAMKALEAFYYKARKSTNNYNDAALLQTSEDAPPAAAVGGYGGKQDAATGILSMMEVIESDFVKSISETKASEEAAATEFTKLKSTLNQEIGNKETDTELNTKDLEEAQVKLAEGKANLKDTMNLLDGALQTLEDLKPQCVDNQMSYAERKAKREDELSNLKKALCALDPEKVEEACK